jgi:hypothetical protein
MRWCGERLALVAQANDDDDTKPRVYLADLDGHGGLDVVVGGETSGQLWLNNGAGRFRQGQQISYDRYDAIALGDVTGDGRIDVFVAGVNSYQVWRGQGDGRFTAGSQSNYR